jgi:hypothetical protein
MKHRKNRLFLVTAVVFLLMFLSMTVQADAAWKKNSNGTYSYYENGKKVTKKWIREETATYYVNSKGVRQTGFLYKGKKWYYFTKKGVLVKSKWIKSGGNLYYAGENGVLYVNGMYQVNGKYTYAFSKKGAVLKGRRTYNKKTYYFASANGRMQTSKWIKTNGKYYYYGADGALVKNQWVGRYYVGKTGLRQTSMWKDDCYLGSDGKAYVGLKKISGSYYYFDPETYRKVVSTTITFDDDVYEFDSNGVGKQVTTNGVATPSVSVESTYYSDPQVTDETLLAAIIYCEAGNQSYTGKMAVGLVLMNRVYNSLFPNTLRELIYQKNQFTPARSGVLTRALKSQTLVNEECRAAAKEVLAQFQNYTSGQKIYLEINGKTEQFPYLFFMTPAAYRSCGLTCSYKTIGDHVFFSVWK